MIKLFDTVELVAAQPQAGLPKGALGVVVEFYSAPDPAYEVEFCNEQGETLASLTLAADQFTTIARGSA